MAELLLDPKVIGFTIAALIGLLGVLVRVFLSARAGEERRRRKIYRLRAKLQRTCPHAEFSMVSTQEGSMPQISLSLVSPVGTINYYCELCNSMAREYDVSKLRAYWESIEFEDLMRELKNVGKARKIRVQLDSLGNWASE